MRILILGVTGMLGRAAFQVLGGSPGLEVYGASRSKPAGAEGAADRLFSGVDVLNHDHLVRVFESVRPDVVLNAVGLIKQLKHVNDPLESLPINAMLPHRLAGLAAAAGARLIHISTDCVFKGDRGGYVESDPADAVDLYGLSKFLGEVSDRPNAITLRTSIIGREQRSANGLIEWFLQAGPQVKGYRQAIFSGLPTVVLSEVIRDHVLPRPDLWGLFHVSVDAIDKHKLLRLIAEVYGRSIEITPVDEPRIDRSLNSDKFRRATGFAPRPWPEMLQHMRNLQG